MNNGVFTLAVFGTGTGKNGLCTHFSGPETVSGGAIQLYFNGFQVSSTVPGHNQCKWFPHKIDSGFRPGPGHSQCDYTISSEIKQRSV